MAAQPVTACLLIIGNEILSGRTQDANLAYLGRRLNDIGVRLTEARVIPDLEDAIVAAVNEARRRFTYVFTTGGIGPTHDDITAASIAKAFGVPVIQHPEARAILDASYPPGELSAARLQRLQTLRYLALRQVDGDRARDEGLAPDQVVHHAFEHGQNDGWYAGHDEYVVDPESRRLDDRVLD